MNYTQADIELLKGMHIDIGEPYQPVTVSAVLTDVHEALTITKADAQQFRRLSDAVHVERMRKQDEAKCEAIRASMRAETVAMAEREIQRRWRAFVKMVAIKAAIAVTWFAAVLGVVWMAVRHG